jgi:hypothetical protein
MINGDYFQGHLMKKPLHCCYAETEMDQEARVPESTIMMLIFLYTALAS